MDNTFRRISARNHSSLDECVFSSRAFLGRLRVEPQLGKSTAGIIKQTMILF